MVINLQKFLAPILLLAAFAPSLMAAEQKEQRPEELELIEAKPPTACGNVETKESFDEVPYRPFLYETTGGPDGLSMFNHPLLADLAYNTFAGQSVDKQPDCCQCECDCCCPAEKTDCCPSGQNDCCLQ